MKNQTINIVSFTTLALMLCISAFTTTTALGQDGRGLSHQVEKSQSKCPPDSRCLYFTGKDTYRTDVQISNGAEEVLSKYSIVTRNNGTKLIWLTDKCRRQETSCANIDLTGREEGEEVPVSDLNKLVKITSVGSDTVKLYFEEFDGDTGQYFVVRGVVSKDMPRVKLRK